MRTEQALWFYSCHMAPCWRKLSHMEAIQTRVVVLISFLFFLFFQTKPLFNAPRPDCWEPAYLKISGSIRRTNVSVMAGNHPIRLCHFAAPLYLRPSSKEPRERGAPLRLDAVLQHSDVALPLVQGHHVHQASVCAHHSGVDGRLTDAGNLRHKREKMLKHHREGRKSSRTVKC